VTSLLQEPHVSRPRNADLLELRQLVVEYGFVVYSVTEKVRANVIGAIENLLGLEVTAVDIVVDDVHVPDTT